MRSGRVDDELIAISIDENEALVERTRFVFQARDQRSFDVLNELLCGQRDTNLKYAKLRNVQL